MSKPFLTYDQQLDKLQNEKNFKFITGSRNAISGLRRTRCLASGLNIWRIFGTFLHFLPCFPIPVLYPLPKEHHYLSFYQQLQIRLCKKLCQTQRILFLFFSNCFSCSIQWLPDSASTSGFIISFKNPFSKQVDTNLFFPTELNSTSKRFEIASTFTITP